MFAVVLNLSGDLRGFITPLMVFVWPFTAVGISTIARSLNSLRIDRRIAGPIVIAAAAAMPWSNLTANYREADRSGDKDAALFHAALFSQLPDRAAFVVEDYASDMALNYYLLTGDAGSSRGIVRVEFNAADVRKAARDRRVFAFARAAAVLQAEGLQFERWDVAGPPLDEWLSALPARAPIVGAAAYVAAPFDLSRVGHPDAGPAGRPRAFEAFAFISRRSPAAWRESDESASLVVDPASLAASLPALSQPLIASADRNGARIELAGDTIARVGAGRALAVLAPNGRLVRALEFPVGEPLRVPFQNLVYELKGQNPCVTLSSDAWTDVRPAFSTGSWVATLPAVGSVVIETMFRDSPGIMAVGRELLAGVMRTESPTRSADGSEVVVTELTRTDGGRPIFRLALDRRPVSARARVRPGGVVPSVVLCPDRPVSPLFRGDGNLAVLRPDFESEPYFGAGWSSADRTATGHARHGSSGAALLLPLETAYSYRLSFDFAVPEPAIIDATANGVAVGTCELRDQSPCELDLPPAALRDGANVLKLSVRDSSRGGAPLTFRGARLSRRAVTGPAR
jgi:hypothetical protein